MDALNGLETEQKVKIEKTPEEMAQEQALRTHLSQLQQWEQAPNQTMEETRAQFAQQVTMQMEQSRQLLNDAATHLPPVTAKKAAPGTPVQETASAQLTYKERQRQKKETKKAQQESSLADYRTHRVRTVLTERLAQQENSMGDLRAEGKRQGVDMRVVQSFTQGCQLNRRGQPATQADLEKQRQDRTFVEDYISKDVQRRTPHLDRITQELLSYKLDLSSMSDEYILNNIALIDAMTQRATCYDNIWADPINQPYFDAMLPHKRELLKAQMEMFITYNTFFVTRLGALGLDVNTGKYYANADAAQGPISILEEARATCAGAISGQSAKVAAKTRQSLDAELVPFRQELHQDFEELRTLPENQELGLTGSATAYAYEDLRKFRDMITSNPAQYEANRAIIDQLYQQVHHCIDALSDKVIESAACQAYTDTHRKDPDVAVVSLVRMAVARMEEIQTESALLTAHQLTCMDAMQHLLRDKEMSAPAAGLLAPIGLLDKKILRIATPAPSPGSCQLQNRAVQEQMAIARTGVDRSNESFAKDQHVSRALQALGIRVSDSPQAQADKKLRGDIFASVQKDYLTFFKSMEQEKIPFSYIDTHAELHKVSKDSAAGFATGGGIDAINESLFQMFTGYLQTDQAMEYCTRAHSSFRDAAVFQQKPEDASDFLLQCLLNSFGANFTEVRNAPDQFADHDSAAHVCRESCRTLLALPAMQKLDPQAREALPEQIKALLAKYEALVQELTRRLNGPLTPPPGPAPDPAEGAQ